MLKDNLHKCPNCELDLKDFYKELERNEKLQVTASYPADTATTIIEEENRPQSSTNTKFKRRESLKKMTMKKRRKASKSVGFTLPSPRTRSGRKRSSAQKIHCQKVSPIENELKRLKIPSKMEQHGTWRMQERSSSVQSTGGGMAASPFVTNASGFQTRKQFHTRPAFVVEQHL